MRLTSAVLLAPLVLAACNGGSSSSSPSIPLGPITSSSLSTFSAYAVTSFASYEAAAKRIRESASFSRQNTTWWFGSNTTTTFETKNLTAARVEYAHALGLTGKGQTIAFSDTWLNTEGHPAFAGKRITRLVPNSSNYASLRDDHGSVAVSIAAGKTNDFTGVAPGADIIFGTFHDDTSLYNVAVEAKRVGAVALSNSWGYDSQYDANPFGQATVFGTDPNSSGNRYLRALKDYAKEGVAVFALSNDPTDPVVDIMAGMPILDPSLEGGWLAVGFATPTFNSERILSARRQSSACNGAAAWCLVADGAVEGAAGTGTGYDFMVGTSFATPQVSGALAILAEAFPNLTPHQLRDRLLASADNSFFVPTQTKDFGGGVRHGFNREFGHGFLNLRGALLPIGPSGLSMSDGSVVSLDDAAVMTGTAVGDAAARSLEDLDVAVADSLAGDFAFSAAILAQKAQPTPLANRVASEQSRLMAEPDQQGALARFEGMHGTELRLTRDSAMRVDALLPAPGSAGTTGITLAAPLGDGAGQTHIGLKLVRDGGDVLGLGAARNGSGAVLASVRLDHVLDFGAGGYASLGAEAGLADAPGRGTLRTQGALAFNALQVEFGQSDLFAAGDRISFGAALPMAVTAGQAQTGAALRAGSGSGSQALAAGSASEISLAPKSREVDFRIGYQTPLSDHSDFRMDLIKAENLGNIAGHSDFGASLTWQIRF